METLFKTFLFPPISTAPDDDRIDYRIPILNSRTRQTLYSIVLALNTDLTEYERLLDLVKGLLPEGEDPQKNIPTRPIGTSKGTSSFARLRGTQA